MTTTTPRLELDQWISNDGNPYTMEKNDVYVDWLRDMLLSQKIKFVPPSELEVERQLGEGAFGCVFLVKRRVSVSSMSRPSSSANANRRGSYTITPNDTRDGAQITSLLFTREKQLQKEAAFNFLFQNGAICVSFLQRSQSSEHKNPRLNCGNPVNEDLYPNVDRYSVTVSGQPDSKSPLLAESSLKKKPRTAALKFASNLSKENETEEMLAMKLLKFITEEKLKDLEREACVLSQLNHPNIVQFRGITMQGKQELSLLFEYMEQGDLVNYLRAHNPDLMEDHEKVNKEPLTYVDLLKMSLQVATGLEYLVESHLVHRDLAARNCLVGENQTVKLSDFGMTRDLYVTDYYKMGTHTLVPLRWLPPESILYRKFTNESDMWSFGVLLWEVFSFGQVPWYAYSNSEVMDIVKAGKVLEKPDRCPLDVYKSLILKCCQVKPSDRISATEAKLIFAGLLEGQRGYCAVKQSSIDSNNYTSIQTVESSGSGPTEQRKTLSPKTSLTQKGQAETNV